jgi:hypothetical protein
MDPASLVAALATAQTIRAQLAAAAMLARMNTDNSASVVQVVNAAEKSMASLANVAAGVGQNVNISA